MAKKTKAYVDTSAFIAFLDRSDSHHHLFRQLFADPPELITSSLVIAEGQGWFLKRYDATRALQFISFIEDVRVLNIHAAGVLELKGAYECLRRFSDQSLTLADALGLAIMDRERIDHCWSTDRHLGLTGKRLVIFE